MHPHENYAYDEDIIRSNEQIRTPQFRGRNVNHAERDTTTTTPTHPEKLNDQNNILEYSFQGKSLPDRQRRKEFFFIYKAADNELGIDLLKIPATKEKQIYTLQH
ncbi:unnamed protein product [Rotaria magnacalcarata]|uniref:Uncharacterized protein n=2 Tax=Rotaria magnacalcarata TaxID=392030 RepID=A0A8S2N6W0_9BILA|nr:unnamed protein product [Rotaria magnacalcarata]